MLYFFLRLFVYTLAAAIVMNVVPGLRLRPEPLFGEALTTVLAYIGVGTIFAILHDFVRPVVLVLAGRLYIWSFGLLALLVDSFNFLIITYLAPTEWDIGWARLGAAMLGAVLMGLLVMALEALFGFDGPRALEVRKTPLYWRWLARLPSGRRSQFVESLRMRQIIAIFQSYSLDILMGLTPLGGFRHAMQKRIYRVRPRLIERDPAVKLRLMLQELGPTFVKFGQLVAARTELLPSAWRLELEKLQDEVKLFPYSEVEEVIRRELGGAPEAVFVSFEREPLAAASTAQVHAATLKSGERVVVKVQRPNIGVIVRADLNVIQDVVDTAVKRLRWLRQFGLGPLFREFAENVRLELDYGNEAYQMRRLHHNMRALPFVAVPEVYSALSTARVITQERVSGVKITEAAALSRAGIDPEQKALEFFRALLQQLLFDGFFHADPHPGNVWVDLESARIVFIDMGMMGRLGRSDRLALAQLLWALREQDAYLATRVLRTLCTTVRADSQDAAALERDVELLLGRHLLAAESPTLTAVTVELMGLLSSHGLRPRQEFALAFKTLGQIEAIMRALMGERPLDEILGIAYDTMKELLLARLESGELAKAVGSTVAQELIGRLPALLAASGKLLDAFEHGQTALQRGADDHERLAVELRESLARGQRRVVLAVSSAGLLLGSALVLFIPSEGAALRIAAGWGLAVSTLVSVTLLGSALWRAWRGPLAVER